MRRATRKRPDVSRSSALERLTVVRWGSSLTKCAAMALASLRWCWHEGEDKSSRETLQALLPASRMSAMATSLGSLASAFLTAASA